MKILVFGLSGSGKTTLAKPFAELINGTSTLTVSFTGAENQIPISMTDFLTGLGATFETVKTIESTINMDVVMSSYS